MWDMPVPDDNPGAVVVLQGSELGTGVLLRNGVRVDLSSVSPKGRVLVSLGLSRSSRSERSPKPSVLSQPEHESRRAVVLARPGETFLLELPRLAPRASFQRVLSSEP